MPAHLALAARKALPLLWTHVTAPLVDDGVYTRALDTFRELDRTIHDSFMTVKPLKNFLWSSTGPLNYQRQPIRWPRTQDIDPVYGVTSAIFMIDTTLGRELGDRIGRCPYLLEVFDLEAIDIDWEEDFEFAELAYRAHMQRSATPR